MIQYTINLLIAAKRKGTTMACTYKLNSTGTVYSVSDFDDYLKSLPHETLAKYSPVVAALLSELSSGIRFSKSPSKTLKQLESENKSTLPKIPSGNVFLNPIDELDYAVRLKADDAFESDSVEQKQVDISDIIPTQKNITIHNLKSTSKYMDEPVNLVLKDNKYYVMDGHHRIANAILAGNNPINANVFDSKINNTKFSKSPQQTTSSTVAQVKSWLPKRVQGMLDSGKLRVVQSVNDLPAHLREAGAAMRSMLDNDVSKYSKLNGIQGLYDAETDKTYLVADMLTKDNTNIVLSHELFHRFYATDPKAKTIMGKMMFGARESFDQASRGKGTKTELSAYQRVINAKTPEKDQIEEYLAYQISSFLENPKNVTPSLANLIKNWIASIRMALLRYGMDMGFVRSLTPRDLVALSQYGSRVDAIANPQSDAVLMKASTSDKDLETLLSTYAKENGAPSRAELAEALRQYRTIESQYFNADGTPKEGAMIALNGEPTNLNKQQWITVRTENFKNWFGQWDSDPENASKVVDENGEPREMWHGSQEPFNEFKSGKAGVRDVSGKNTHGFYFSPLKRVGGNYAGNNGVNRSFFLNIKNQKIANDYFEIGSLNEGKVSAAIGEGYDGYSFAPSEKDLKSGYYGDYNEEYVAFNPNQIKSATSNTGVFGKSNDIRFSEAPKRWSRAFFDWWDGSQFSDKNGQPIKFYHGSNSTFNEFSHTKIGTGTPNHSTSGLGFFFSPQRETATNYGSDVREFYLSAQKVKGMTVDQLPQFDSIEEAKAYADKLKAQGFDAIYLKDAKYAIVFESNQAKLTSNDEPTQSPDIRASFAGESAQTADKYQLATAKERLANGDDKEVVRRDTGWFIGVDGKWRFEINDKNASISDNGKYWAKTEVSGNYSNLEDVLNHPALFNAYPELKDLAVWFKSSGMAHKTAGAVGNMPSGRLAIMINQNHSGFLDKKSNFSNFSLLKSVLTHEIQHAIQRVEKFSTGGNPDNLYEKSQLTELTKKESRLIDEVDTSDTARAYFEARGRYFPFLNSMTEKYGKDYFMKWTTQESDKKELLFNNWRDTAKSWNKSKEYEDNESKIYQLRKNGDKTITPFEQYQRLAGEIEARNTQARLGLTAEQRRNTPIADTQDIPDSEAIVVWNGTEMHSTPANADNGVRFSVASDAVDYLTNQPRNVTSASDLQSLIDSKKLPKQKRFNTDSIIENFVDSSHPLRVWSRILPDTLTANKMLDNFDRASGVKATIEKQAAIKFKRQISASIKDFAKEQGVNFDVAMEIIGNWASMRYALESGQKWIYTDTEMTALKSDIETKFGKANLEQAIQPVLDMNQWRLSELDDKEGRLSGTDLTDLQTPNYVPLLDNHAINDSYAELEDSAKFVGFKDFRNSLKTIHKGLFDDIKAASPALSNDEINDKIKEDYELKKTKKGVSITNPDAQLAMTDLSNEAVPSILKPIAAFTRFQSKMVTAFLVGFAPTNMIRDVAERTENLRTRTVAGHESVDMNSVANQAIKLSVGLLYNIKKVMMNVLAEGTILEGKFKADNTNPDVQDFREYLKLGASSTYGDLLADDKQGLAKELKKVGSIPNKAMDVLLLWNNAFEMISGFSAYQSMVAHGIDKKSAAATSLNLMNFRKRGKIMSPLRALYMFAQPIAIGGHQLAKTLSTRRGLMRLAAYTVASMILYSLLRGFDDDDDELGYNRMDESSNFSLYRNIHIPLGDGEYFDLPVGFGMQQLAWSHGVNFVRTALGTMTTGEMLGESALLWVKSTAPVSPAEGSIMKNPAVYLAQTFTPQIARPVMNVALDVNAFMSPLTNSRYERTDKAKALQGRANTPQEYKDIAEVLGKAGIDMYPEQIRELMRGYGAGLFNEAIKYFIENPAKEDKGLKTVSPLIDRWIKVSNDDQIKQKLYYNARDKMNAASVAKSNGAELTPEESQLAELGDTLKKREASTRGKFAAATKAEKAGQSKRAELLRKVADMQRNKYMDFAFEKMKEITG